jgi:hypothetical protein
MSGLGLGFSAELADAILNDSVRIRDALVLSEMFKPGCNHECFEEAPLSAASSKIAASNYSRRPSALAGIRTAHQLRRMHDLVPIGSSWQPACQWAQVCFPSR